MKRLSPEQIHYMAILEKSADKLPPLQAEARRLGLAILEHDLIRMESDLRTSIGLQQRAFRDDSLCDPYPLFPQGSFPYGKNRDKVVENKGLF